MCATFYKDADKLNLRDRVVYLYGLKEKEVVELGKTMVSLFIAER